MRITIVIVALISFMSLAMDMTQEVEKRPDHALLSSQLMDSTDVAVTLDAEEIKGRDQNPAHLTDVKWVSELGSLLLIGVALAGFITAPQRKAREARNERRII